MGVWDLVWESKALEGSWGIGWFSGSSGFALGSQRPCGACKGSDGQGLWKFQQSTLGLIKPGPKP